MLTANQVAKIIGVTAPDGSRRDEWLREMGITNVVKGPKHGKGFMYFAGDEEEVYRIAEKRRALLSGVARPPISSGHKFKSSTSFVASESVLTEISAINKKLDDLIELLTRPNDKTF